ncbi:MAG TPA: (d)CMP kinase [Thermohalobaculum sp.]|nr:(d)CMP kinase [Thermohalobaculum sp.]
MSFVVAIDGPAASGKGTIARAVARHFGFAHLDTGLLYRAVGGRLIEEGGPVEPTRAARIARELRAGELEPDALRGDAVARAASQAAAIPQVRQALLEFQRSFARRAGGAVLDGRDIATVVCPDADVKLFVVAADEVRARRRWEELRRRGEDPGYAAVLEDLRARDSRDSGRAVSPLARADDAHLLDTTELSIDAAVARATEIIEQALSRGDER